MSEDENVIPQANSMPPTQPQPIPVSPQLPIAETPQPIPQPIPQPA